MAQPTPTQLRRRGRVELLIRILQPGLDLVLAAGDRLSRTVDRSDDPPLPAIRFSDEVRPLERGTSHDGS
jgi:hypothetical protein